MKRRQFLAAGAATAVAAPLAAPAIAQGRLQWNLVTSWPKNAPGVGVNAQRFADRVTAMSDGRLTVRLYAAGELVPPFGVLDAVSAGTAELGHATPYYWQGKAKALHYFTGVPLGLTAQEMAAWIYFGDGQKLWDEVYAPFGVRAFYAGNSGTQAGGWFRKELKGLDDLKGLKFRIAGLGAEVMRKLGVVVTLTPPGEIFQAMQSGAVDAAEWVGPWNDLAFGLHRIAKFYYLPAFHEPGPSLEVIVNRAKFEALPKDLQAIVENAAMATATHALADFSYHNAMSLEPLVSQHQVQLRDWPAEIAAAFGPATKAVLEEVAAGDPLTRKVHDSFSAFLAKARAWTARSELSVMLMREKLLG
ncbi:MAG: TRAP transporter substrate-binding protein DctP [Thalassobaculales bacterium]